MKIKPPSRSVLDTERFHDCADALEPYVYALFRIVDYRQADTAQPNFRQVREAARAAGWTTWRSRLPSTISRPRSPWPETLPG